MCVRARETKFLVFSGNFFLLVVYKPELVYLITIFPLSHINIC